MMAAIEAGLNSNGFVVKPMDDINSCLDRKSSDNTTVDGLEVGTSSHDLMVAPMEINRIFSAGFNSNGHAVAQMELIVSSPDGFNSDDFTMVLGRVFSW